MCLDLLCSSGFLDKAMAPSLSACMVVLVRPTLVGLRRLMLISERSWSQSSSCVACVWEEADQGSELIATATLRRLEKKGSGRTAKKTIIPKDAQHAFHMKKKEIEPTEFGPGLEKGPRGWMKHALKPSPQNVASTLSTMPLNGMS